MNIFTSYNRFCEGHVREALSAGSHAPLEMLLLNGYAYKKVHQVAMKEIVENPEAKERVHGYLQQAVREIKTQDAQSILIKLVNSQESQTAIQAIDLYIKSKGDPNVVVDVIKQLKIPNGADLQATLQRVYIKNLIDHAVKSLQSHSSQADQLNEIAQGIDITAALHSFVIVGATESIQKALQLGIDPEQPNQLGDTLLHTSAKEGRVAIVRLLLERGADPTRISHAGRTPLQAACVNHRAAVAEVLENASPNPLNNADQGMAKAVFETLSLDKYVAFVDAISMHNPEVDTSGLRELAYQINKLVMLELYKKAPSDLGIAIEQLLDLFAWIPPIEFEYAIEADGEEISPFVLRKRLVKMIDDIKKKRAFLGTPPADKPHELALWYKNLERMIQHIISKCGNNHRPIIELALAGGKCGAPYYEAADKLYRELNNAHKGFRDEILEIVDRFRKAVVGSMITKEDNNIHAFNKVQQIIDEDAGISPDEKINRHYFLDYITPVSLEGEAEKKEVIRQFYSTFTKEALVDYVLSALPQEAFIDWIKCNLPESWNQETARIKQDPLKYFIKHPEIDLSDSNSVNWNRNIEEARKRDFLETQVYDMETGKINPSIICYTLSKLNIIKI